MAKKMYSAFISSVYESLQDERNAVIDSLLDYRVFPVCMEHFTASSNKNFQYIKDLIDESDFLILILGRQYGSCDNDGVSWTEKEYNYAMEIGRDIVAIICDELDELRKRRDDPSLTADEQKQIAFSDRIAFARTVSAKQTIGKIIGQFFAGIDFNHYAGWSRNVVHNEKSLSAWAEQNKAYNLSGQWYHVHLSNDDTKYIRTGTIMITQQFNPDNYLKLSMEGNNYNMHYDAASDEIVENMLKYTHWKGSYDLERNGEMFGIFHSKRAFSDEFNGMRIDKGMRRGIHDFTFDVDRNELPMYFHGEFHDEAPSPKTGVIYVFRTAEARKDFLKTNFKYLLDGNK